MTALAGQSPVKHRSFDSSQFWPMAHAGAPLWQVPLAQDSEPLQKSASAQLVPSGWTASVGQLALLPVQFSATSQVPVEGRHGVLEGANPSAGQAVDTPSHCSATSQMPAEARHSVPLG